MTCQGLYALTILFTLLAVLPVIVAASAARVVRIAVFGLSLLLLLFALKDWVGYQSPLPYQLILKAVHTPLAIFGCIIAWRWMRETRPIPAQT